MIYQQEEECLTSYGEENTMAWASLPLKLEELARHPRGHLTAPVAVGFHNTARVP